MTRSATNRGFVIYDEFDDRYRHRVSVQESSLATEACCWIFTGDGSGGAAHLTVEQAIRVRDALDVFIRENEETP